MTEPHPLVALLNAAQCDFTAGKAKLAEAQRQIAALGLQAAPLPVCRFCGPVRLPATTTMVEHEENVHGMFRAESIL